MRFPEWLLPTLLGGFAFAVGCKADDTGDYPAQSTEVKPECLQGWGFNLTSSLLNVDERIVYCEQAALLNDTLYDQYSVKDSMYDYRMTYETRNSPILGADWRFVYGRTGKQVTVSGTPGYFTFVDLDLSTGEHQYALQVNVKLHDGRMYTSGGDPRQANSVFGRAKSANTSFSAGYSGPITGQPSRFPSFIGVYANDLYLYTYDPAEVGLITDSVSIDLQALNIRITQLHAGR